MELNSKIYVAGHTGMVGSALCRRLKYLGYTNLLVANRSQVDLMNPQDVKFYFERERPEFVFFAAAKVGGIQANMQQPFEFLYNNLTIQNNVINQAYQSGVKKFCFIGSSCIYPRQCPQPIKEEYFMTGPLEPTNEGYALAKIAGIRLVQALNKQHGFNAICPMPCNLYGPNDSFDLQHSHVLSALVRKFVDAVEEGRSEVQIWGTGIARREFLHVDDLAEALVFLMNTHNNPEIINIGCGYDVSINELAGIIQECTGFNGRLTFDRTKPDGMLRKCLDVSRMKALGYIPMIRLERGIKEMINDYKKLKRNTA